MARPKKVQSNSSDAVVKVSVTYNDDTADKTFVIKNPAGYISKPQCNPEGVLNSVLSNMKVK